MLSRMSKMLRNQKGFTLVELMTVLIILGVILGIGIPKYLQIQAKSGWEADEATIRNFAKAAETYAVSINKFDGKVSIQTLIGDNLIDGGIILNRINSGDKDDTSIKNKGETDHTVSAKHAGKEFVFNQRTGTVKNLGAVVKSMIGVPPYGEMPTYPQDSETDDLASTT